jgi:hypothetical protein
MLHLILGGAAVHRCDNWLVYGIGFSRWGKRRRAKDSVSTTCSAAPGNAAANHTTT